MTRTTAPARRLVAAALVCLFAVASGSARADSHTDFLVTRLRADDFRVRTNAALALGQTGDSSVVNPLCGALSDSSEVVRQAVAVALQRLAKPAATGCLKDRLSVETSEGVKRQLVKALEASRPPPPGGSASSPHVVANAKYYVALSAISNQTTRGTDDIAQVVGDAVRAKLDELGGFQVAPDGESPEQARAATSKRNLKGYYLEVRVEKFDYSGGNLRVRVKLAVFTYPEGISAAKSRRASPRAGSARGTSPPRTTSSRWPRRARWSSSPRISHEKRQEHGPTVGSRATIPEHDRVSASLRMSPSNFPTTSTGRYKRSFRNLLIDSRFQLKYTGFMVLVALVVSVLLGGFLYATSREVITESKRVVDESQRVVEESKKVSDVVMMSIKDNYGQDGDLAQAFNEEAQKADQKVLEQQRALVEQQKALIRQQQKMLAALVGALAFLVTVIGCFGIWFTHKISGPVYKMKILLRQVGDGRLVFQGKLRKGDELQDFFEAFSSMVDKLRERQAKEVAQLDVAIKMAGVAGASQESLSKVQLVRDEMKRAIDG